MPTFKADYIELDPNRSAEENLLELMNQHNELIQRIARTVNNLDEENLNISLTQGSDTENE